MAAPFYLPSSWSQSVISALIVTVRVLQGAWSLNLIISGNSVGFIDAPPDGIPRRSWLKYPRHHGIDRFETTDCAG
ncbi:hypothetical protein V8C26DRAFT_402459 [Trichoderma gracile]